MKNFEELEELLNAHPEDWKEVLESAPYFLRVRDCEYNPNWHLVKYTQGVSPEESPIVKQSRGTVFEIIDGVAKVISAGFTRFYNHWRECKDDIDWSTAVVWEKMDGQLIKPWKHKGKVYWNSNAGFGVRDENMSNKTKTVYSYEKLLSIAAGDTSWLDKVPDGWTFMLELCSPYNQIICRYDDIKLWLLGARDAEGNEHWPEEVKEKFLIPYDIPRKFEAHSLEEVLDITRDWKAAEQEGVVVCDADFHRIKVKCGDYLNYVKSTMDLNGSDNSIFKMLVRMKIDNDYKFDDVNSPIYESKRDIIDEHTNNLEKFDYDLRKACNYLLTFYIDTKDLTQKEFAQLVLKRFKTSFDMVFRFKKWTGTVDEYVTKILKFDILQYGLGKHEDGVNSSYVRFVKYKNFVKEIIDQIEY